MMNTVEMSGGVTSIFAQFHLLGYLDLNIFFFGETFIDISDYAILYLQPLWLVGTSGKNSQILNKLTNLKPGLSLSKQNYHCFVFCL